MVFWCSQEQFARFPSNFFVFLKDAHLRLKKHPEDEMNTCKDRDVCLLAHETQCVVSVLSGANQCQRHTATALQHQPGSSVSRCQHPGFG
jgi:hypothetical protein